MIEAARDELGSAFERFVPGHPIAGRERSGVDYSEAALFNDKVLVSTPVPATDVEAVHRVEALWRSVGSHVRRMTRPKSMTVCSPQSAICHICLRLRCLHRLVPSQTLTDNLLSRALDFVTSPELDCPARQCGPMYVLRTGTPSPWN